jgi:L-aminopeptidase/D-esterase-like protein
MRGELPKPLLAGTNTTLGVVATDAVLTKVQANRLAMVAHDGLARAINPVHTMSDGDTLFALATGRVPLDGDAPGMTVLGAMAAEAVARATLRAVQAARTVRIGESHFPCAADLA